MRPHEGEPLKENPPSPPRGDEGDVPLIEVDPVGGGCDDGNMNPQVATTKRRREVSDDDPHWQRFWSLYPNKKSKGAARKAWVRAVAKVESPAVLIRAVEKYVGGITEMRYVPHPATWLNQEKWLDEDGNKVESKRWAPPKKDQMCPRHDGEWAERCRLCASERLAGDDPEE